MRNVCFIVLKWKLPKRTFRRYARSYASQKTKRKDASFDKFEVSPSQTHPVTVRAHAYTRLADFWGKKNTRETYGAQYNTHKHVAPLVKANVLPAICQWLRSRNTTVQIEVLRTLQVLAESPLATRRMVEPDLMKALTAQVTKQKNKVRSTGWLSQAYATCSRAANNQTTNGTHTHTHTLGCCV